MEQTKRLGILPRNIDEAAEEYGRENIILPDDYNDGDIEFYAEATGEAFKAGAEWMAGQIKQEQPELPDNLDKAAFEYENTLWEDGHNECGYCPQDIYDAFKSGAGFAVQRIISLIESRIAEILGDAQPAPVLRMELRELIDKIKNQ